MKPHYDPDRHHRQSIRLRGWDYAGAGTYFVTVCTYQRECILGAVNDDQMRFSEVGRLVDAIWHRTLAKQADVHLDALQVMPNHVHAIIVLTGSHRADSALTGQDTAVRAGTLGAIVGNLKTICTRRVNKIRNTPGAPLWQRNYWEHIIRDEKALEHIRTYIVSNPALWHEDQLNASNNRDPTAMPDTTRNP